MADHTERKQIMIIGAGASGMMAAISAAEEAQKQNIAVRITVFEHAAGAGSKLLVTGNGRCNLGNRNRALSNYHSDRPAFVEEVFLQRSMQEVERQLQDMGIRIWERDGYLYPYSRQASTVNRAFLNEIDRLGIRVRYSTHIASIGICAEGVYAETDSGYRYTGDVLILASGSCAGKVQGVDAGGYQMAQSLGVQVTNLYPSLVQLTIEENWRQKLAGVRSICSVQIPMLGLSEYGEVQFTEYGISGIPVFQLSGAVNEYLGESFGKSLDGELDLMPELDREQLEQELYRRVQRNLNCQQRTLLDGFFHENLNRLLLETEGIYSTTTMDRLSIEEVEELAELIKALPVTITGSKGYGQAQVVRGGICTDEVDPETMSLRRYPEIHVAGELVNVDGRCGGYNLMWAFASGWIAGKHAV